MELHYLNGKCWREVGFADISDSKNDQIKRVKRKPSQPPTWECSVGARTVVEYEDTGEIVDDGGEVLRVAAIVEGAVLPKEAPLEDVPVVVQLVRHRLTVDLHAGGEDDQIVPVAHLRGKD